MMKTQTNLGSKFIEQEIGLMISKRYAVLEISIDFFDSNGEN